MSNMSFFCLRVLTEPHHCLNFRIAPDFRVQEERDKRKGLREHLKNELGVDQAAIDKIAPVLDKPYAGNGEFDDDPYTTNLYICNLPQDVRPFPSLAHRLYSGRDGRHSGHFRLFWSPRFG